MTALVCLLSGKPKLEPSRGILLLLSWNFSCLERDSDGKPSYTTKNEWSKSLRRKMKQLCDSCQLQQLLHADTCPQSQTIWVSVRCSPLSHHGTQVTYWKWKNLEISHYIRTFSPWKHWTVMTKRAEEESKACTCTSTVGFMIFGLFLLG